jgi:ABC-type transporter Mla subunit MlaD
MIYVINFIKKTALLIDDTRANLNRQTKQLGETLEKVDDMVVDIHSFVKQASSSLEKFNEMSDQITGVVRKIDTKANNLMVVADDLSSIARGVVSSVEKPIRGIADFIGNIGNYINKIKSFFPTKLKN